MDMPQATHTRSMAQNQRAALIESGLVRPDTYVTSVTLPDGTPVWRIEEPRGAVPQHLRVVYHQFGVAI